MEGFFTRRMEGHGGIQLDEKMFEEAKYGHLASARVGISRNAFSNQLLDSLRRARQIVSSNIKVLDYYGTPYARHPALDYE